LFYTVRLTYVGHPYRQTEMFAGRVAYCHLVSHVQYADGTDRQTDIRTDARPSHYALQLTRLGFRTYMSKMTYHMYALLSEPLEFVVSYRRLSCVCACITAEVNSHEYADQFRRKRTLQDDDVCVGP